jgi:hypothetical protein
MLGVRGRPDGTRSPRDTDRFTALWAARSSGGNGMSEGAGFVNTALLEEEHDQPLTGPGTTHVLDGRRDERTLARSRIAEEGGQGRPQAARRGSLEGPVIMLSDNGL